MTELMNLILVLTQDVEFIKAYIMELKKSKLEQFLATWWDGQEVMQALHISKRTLQTLRDNGTLPASRVNGKFYYRFSDLEHLLESHYSKSNSDSHGNK